MNVLPGTLLVVATTVAAIVIVVVSPTWARIRRARRLAAVDLILATSYIDRDGSPRVGEGEPSPPPGEPAEMSRVSSDIDDAPLEETTAGAVRPRGRDPLTGLLDVQAFQEVLDHEDAREDRYRRPTTVVLMELDGLDRLVERLGHEAGDRVEPDVANTISRLARRADYVARLAPGRFAVLMPETDEIVAINYVERIRQACEQWLESGAIAMRLSIGWASTTGRASVTTAMQVASDRMHIEARNHARLSSDGASENGLIA